MFLCKHVVLQGANQSDNLLLEMQSGEAISLDCQCRGELALRHKACAIKWSRVKGDAVCDICKSPVRLHCPPLVVGKRHIYL